MGCRHACLPYRIRFTCCLHLNRFACLLACCSPKFACCPFHLPSLLGCHAYPIFLQAAGRPVHRTAFTRGAADGNPLFNPFDFTLKNVANTGVLAWGGKLYALYEVSRRVGWAT